MIHRVPAPSMSSSSGICCGRVGGISRFTHCRSTRRCVLPLPAGTRGSAGVAGLPDRINVNAGTRTQCLEDVERKTPRTSARNGRTAKNSSIGRYLNIDTGSSCKPAAPEMNVGKHSSASLVALKPSLGTAPEIAHYGGSHRSAASSRETGASTCALPEPCKPRSRRGPARRNNHLLPPPQQRAPSGANINTGLMAPARLCVYHSPRKCLCNTRLLPCSTLSGMQRLRAAATLLGSASQR